MCLPFLSIPITRMFFISSFRIIIYLVPLLLSLASRTSAGRNYQVDVCAYELSTVHSETSGVNGIFARMQIYQKGLPYKSYLEELRQLCEGYTGRNVTFTLGGPMSASDTVPLFMRLITDPSDNDKYHEIAKQCLERSLECLSPQKNIRCVRLSHLCTHPCACW